MHIVLWLQGRSIIVKYADSHKGKTGQPPFSAGVVPMAALPMAPGYVQSGKTHINAAPVGFTYPQTAASYPATSYPSPTTAPTYPIQGQVSYPPASAKNDPLGIPPTPPLGMNSYPYYYPKQ